MEFSKRHWIEVLKELQKIPAPQLNPLIPWLIVLLSFLPLPPCSTPLRACAHWNAFWMGDAVHAHHSK